MSVLVDDRWVMFVYVCACLFRGDDVWGLFDEMHVVSDEWGLGEEIC